MAGMLGDDFHPSFNSSVDQGDLFPDNTPDSFQCKLPCQLQFFNEEVKVALHYISIPTKWKVIHENNNTFQTRKFRTVVNQPTVEEIKTIITHKRFFHANLVRAYERAFANMDRARAEAKGVAEILKVQAAGEAAAAAETESASQLPLPEESEEETNGNDENKGNNNNGRPGRKRRHVNEEGGAGRHKRKKRQANGEEEGEEGERERGVGGEESEDEKGIHYIYKYPDAIINLHYPEPLNTTGVESELNEIYFNKQKWLDSRSFFKHFFQYKLHPLVRRHLKLIFKIDDSVSIDDVQDGKFEIEVKFAHPIKKIEFPQVFEEAWKRMGIPANKIGRKLSQGFTFFAPNFINHDIEFSFTAWMEFPPAEPSRLDHSEEKTRTIDQGWRTKKDEFIKQLNNLANLRKTVTTSTASADASAGGGQPQQQQTTTTTYSTGGTTGVKHELFTLTEYGHLKLNIPKNYEIKFNGLLGTLLGFPNDEWISKDYAYTTSWKLFTLHPVTSFFLYCNVIEPVISSGSFSHLLSEIVPHKEIPDREQSDVTPYYPIRLAYKRLPLNSTFNTIGFKITDQYGQKVHFIGGETSIHLHFIRTKRNLK